MKLRGTYYIIINLIFLPFFMFSQTFTNNLGLSAGTELKSFSIPQNIDYFPKVKYQPGIYVGISRFLNSSFNINGKIGLAVVKHPSAFQNKNKSISMFEAIAALQYKLNNNYILPESFKVQPFILAGIGLNKIQNLNNSFFLPFGFGANIPITKDWKAQLNSTYHFATQRTELNYYNIGIGSIWSIGKEKIRTITRPELNPENLKDTDKDGVPDISDNCPNEIGNKNTYGCPDSDNDGVIDRYDDCPFVKGYLNYKGCLDTDGDGISDNLDKCPETYGLKELDGCTAPDTDGDGIPDSKDKCPKIKGSIIQSGCPLKN
jgi:OOP family OmpA-OmpF porin